MGHSECRDPPCFSMRSRIELLPFLSLDKAYEIKKNDAFSYQEKIFQ